MNIDYLRKRLVGVFRSTAGRRAARLAGRGLVCAALLAAVVAPSCQREEEEYGTRIFPLDAFCKVSVDGIGEIDVETDYLPHVIQCENGGAGPEALKAQAVAARSYMYYKMQTSGHVADGTDDQVYSCSRTPGTQHYDAVNATSGQVLTYNGVVVCAFYVAGADPSNRSTCVAVASDPSTGNTERYVTYNEGRSGGDVVQTTLGSVNPSNYRNRGCMSQWGSRCLEEAGYGFLDILHFYYGEDVLLETAVGSCVTNPCAPSDETCDGLDDDCDGQTDEDYVPRGCGTGECAAMSTCSGGVEQCTPLSPPSPDDRVCDGRDEDCDGTADEDYVPTTCGEGICQALSVCVGGVESCTPAPPEGSDETCEGAGDAGVDASDAPGRDGAITEEGGDGAGVAYEAGLEGGCGCSMAGINL
jgi:hypothetical protein